MAKLNRRSGTIHDKSGAHLADVTFTLNQTGPDNAFGRIWIGEDPQPASRFTGDPSLAGGQRTYLLITENGFRVEIFFTSGDGALTCVLADQAREALK